MRINLSALSIAALLSASGTAIAQDEPRPKSWIDHVRFHSLRALNDLGRELSSMAAAMHKGLVGLKNDTAAGLTSITTEGRRGLASASKTLSQATNRVVKDTHNTFLNVGRTVVPGVASQPASKAPTALAEKVESPILAPHFLRGHDIVVAWQLNTGGRPIHASALFEDRLLVETTDQNLYSFEPTTGVLQWLYNLPGPSQCGYSDDPNNILTIAKDVYYELDRVVGRPRRRIVLPFPASSPPAIRGSDVIISSWERRVIALDREKRTREWSYASDEAVVAAVAVSPDLIYVADTGGELVGYSLTSHSAKWTYKAHDGFRVTPVIYLIDVIVPAEDLFVHCINRFSGLCRWKYPVQGQVTQPVWVDEDVVYFSADGDAFYAVSYKDGKLLWRCPKGGWPVALGKENIYIRGNTNEVWCLHRKTGEKRWSVSAQPFTHFVRNTVNDHIYLCTDTGLIYALYLRGDHLEKKAAAPPPEKEKPKGVEEPEPGVGPSEGPAPKAKMPAPRPRPPVKEKAQEPAEKPAPKAVEEEEAPPATKAPEKGAAKLPAVKSKAPEGEKTPAELEEEEEAKKKDKE